MSRELEDFDTCAGMEQAAKLVKTHGLWPLWDAIGLNSSTHDSAIVNRCDGTRMLEKIEELEPLLLDIISMSEMYTASCKSLAAHKAARKMFRRSEKLLSALHAFEYAVESDIEENIESRNQLRKLIEEHGLEGLKHEPDPYFQDVIEALSIKMSREEAARLVWADKKG